MKMSQVYPQPKDLSVKAIVDEQYCSVKATTLTVWNKSQVLAGQGFTALDSNGNLLFRVDTYDDLLLMDARGKPLLTLCRKLPSLHQRWEGFLGNKIDGKKPLFTVRKSSILPTNNCVQVFLNCGFICKPCADYEIEGSFSQRGCTIYASTPRVPAAMVGFFCVSVISGTVKRKRGAAGIMLGKQVFSLCIEHGFDQAFIMGLIIVLDQIDSDLPLVKLIAEQFNCSETATASP
ncbi:hypothetical protein KI387_033989 [Taxus chinensis]|uniref:Uncharacterized protein n=1 Tax=Taxus chinensis TaxID=29808 RepID=A0AA38F6A8_TAXCH|nr:hypothetical protein KI387_033989 [Taxus chinensis]